MNYKNHLINLIDMMVGLSQAQKDVYVLMDIKQLEEKYELALKEKNEEMVQKGVLIYEVTIFNDYRNYIYYSIYVTSITFKVYSMAIRDIKLIKQLIN